MWSRPFLRDPRSHGFYRFFAFEAIIALILFNALQWFRDPFSPHQIISWVILGACLFMALHGFYLLHVIGSPQGNFENTTALVTVGAYKYIRHPLYSSILLLGWGVFFKAPSLYGAILALIATAFIAATARIEERENLRKFGIQYAGYMRETRMFFPYVL